MAHKHSSILAGYLCGFTVTPEDIEQLSELHTAFNPKHVNRLPEDADGEHGFVPRSLDRWADRAFRRIR